MENKATMVRERIQARVRTEDEERQLAVMQAVNDFCENLDCMSVTKTEEELQEMWPGMVLAVLCSLGREGFIVRKDESVIRSGFLRMKKTYLVKYTIEVPAPRS